MTKIRAHDIRRPYRHRPSCRTCRLPQRANRARLRRANRIRVAEWAQRFQHAASAAQAVAVACNCSTARCARRVLAFPQCAGPARCGPYAVSSHYRVALPTATRPRKLHRTLLQQHGCQYAFRSNSHDGLPRAKRPVATQVGATRCVDLRNSRAAAGRPVGSSI